MKGLPQSHMTLGISAPQLELGRVGPFAGRIRFQLSRRPWLVIARKAARIHISGHASMSAKRDLFRGAVSNLLANALHYTPAGQSISMTAGETDRGVSIMVQNPGEGIAADFPKVFDRFNRGDRARSNSGTSTGLGLAIVKTIVEIHGGAATAQSEEGRLRLSSCDSQPRDRVAA